MDEVPGLDTKQPMRLSTPSLDPKSADRRRSFDDAQSRLKCRKLLGIGGKEPSKVLQLLGRNDSYLINLPHGYRIWQIVTSVLILFFAVTALAFPGTCLVAFGVNDPLASSLCARLLGGALIGIAVISWNTEPLSASVVWNTLMLQYVYAGIASLSLICSFLSRPSKFLFVVFVLHLVLFAGSLAYFIHIKNLHKPQPEKPNKIIEPEENHVD